MNVRKKLKRLLCLVGIHDLEGKLTNVRVECDKSLTLGWHECKRCTHSKIAFVYSNWKGPTPLF